jgi:hypothetical protein
VWRYTALWVLRYLLLAGSIAGLAFFAHVYATTRRFSQPDGFIFFGFVVGLILNFLYIFACPPFGSRSKSRLARLTGLWLDAKERELRERASRPQQLS